MKSNLRKLLLTRVYNGLSTTIFCVTSVRRRLLDTTTIYITVSNDRGRYERVVMENHVYITDSNDRGYHEQQRGYLLRQRGYSLV